MRTVLRTAAVLLPLALSLAAVAPAWAHRLNVFASVEGDEVVVEAKFSTGRIPVAGRVRVSDGADDELATYGLEPDGTARFPLDREAAGEGLAITVTTSGQHEGYWILTPDDIARGTGVEGSGAEGSGAEAASMTEGTTVTEGGEQ